MVKDIFEAKVGDVLEPVELEGKYVVAAVTAEEKDAVMSVEKARPMVEPILRNKEKAKRIAEKIGKVASLDAVATANNTVALRADSVSFVSPVISGAGYEPKVAGYAFNKKHLNKISAPISGNSGLFLIEPLALGATANSGASLDDTKNSLRGQVRNSAMSSSMQALREKGKIKDMRSKFL
jgi:peptidyl-prolyl cis-trans isomerase D